MKKHYYFDKIEIVANNVRFINSSEPVGTIWYVHTFKKFLNLLKQTKLQDNLKYDIFCIDSAKFIYHSSVSFEFLIKYFANLVYEDRVPQKEVLVDFYNKAKKIYDDAKEDKNLLLTAPSELIK